MGSRIYQTFVAWIYAGVTVFLLVLLCTVHPDEFGLVFGIVMLVIMGMKSFFAFKRLKAEKTRNNSHEQKTSGRQRFSVGNGYFQSATNTANVVNRSQEKANIRRLQWLAVSALSVLSVIIASDLYQLESGTVASVRVWGPIALIYRFLGFWPAVLICPALALFIVVSTQKKLKSINKQISEEEQY